MCASVSCLGQSVCILYCNVVYAAVVRRSIRLVGRSLYMGGSCAAGASRSGASAPPQQVCRSVCSLMGATHGWASTCAYVCACVC